MNGRDLPKENGAANRKGTPIKQGYKQSKWVTKLIVTSHMATGKIWDLNGLGDDNRSRDRTVFNFKELGSFIGIDREFSIVRVQETTA